jgi:PAS domain S-box-containing protein
VQKRVADSSYRMFFEESKDVMFFSSPNGQLIDINQAGLDLFGYESREELFRCDIGRDLYYNIRDRIKLQQQLTKEGYVSDFEVTLKRKNGRIVNALISASQIYDTKSNVSSYRGIIKDITEQKKLQQQLLQTQKMEAIGTFAEGIAHDFNNILGAILGYSELLRMQLKEKTRARANLDEIYKAGLRAANLVKQILSFSQRGEKKYCQLKLSEIADKVLIRLQSSLSENVEIQTDYDIDGDCVLADPSQIHQAIMNLCKNAAEALQTQGGTMTLSTKLITIQALKLDEGLHLVPGDYVRLRLHDTGPGMSPEIIELIFNPLFTTKPVGQGTGMGLTESLAIIKRHGGDIIVNSTEGCGSALDVYLPWVQNDLKESEKHMEKIMPGNEHILFVDDDKAIVEVNEQLLNYLGYQTTVVTTPEKALGVFKTNPHSFDLVISDWTMPEISGAELITKLKEINSQIPIIISTGYKDAFSDEDVANIGAEAIVKKPITISDLSQLIRSVLDARYQSPE